MPCSSPSCILTALAAFLASAELGSAPALAQETPSIEIRTVDIGYGGKYRSGFWTPIWLTLRSPVPVSGRLEILAPDGDGVPAVFGSVESNVQLASGKDATFLVLVKIGPERSTLSVRLKDELGRVHWQARLPSSTPKPLPAAWELVVSLGESPATAEAVGLVRRDGGHRLIATAITDPIHVPDVWWGWEGVETIVLPTGAGVTAKLSAEQWNALVQWVEIGGGRLVLCVGEAAPTALESGSVLADLAPGKLKSILPLRDLNKFEELTGQPLTPTGDVFRPQVTHLSEVTGRIETTVTDLVGEVPLVVRAPRGMGEVVFLAVDPDGPALSKWAGSGRLLSPALADSARGPRAPQSQRRPSSRLGYDDLSGQLRAALDVFPPVRVTNVTTVAVLTLAYLALIGPLDFFLVRRWKRPALTWFSFPIWIALFCAVGWYAARASHGTAGWTNHCEIVDIDAERQVARGVAWIHLYDAKTSAHDLSLEVDPASIGMNETGDGWIVWQGLPGNGLGGLAANQLATPALVSYQVSEPGPHPSISGVPIQIAGSKALSARWWSRCSLKPLPALTLNEYGLLEGEVANPLPIELRDCMLVYDEWMYRVKTLAPGQRASLVSLDPLNLEARLQQRTVANAKDVLSPWDREGADVPRIVQMLMFHESARGSTYTNLTHRYQSYLDLTPRIRCGRAILVGRIARRVTRVEVDGRPAEVQVEPWTWVRIVIPVTPRTRLRES